MWNQFEAAHTYIHTYIPTYIHTYIHTDMCVLLSFPKGLFKDDILNKLLSTETNYKINWVILTITIRISTINRVETYH